MLAWHFALRKMMILSGGPESRWACNSRQPNCLRHNASCCAIHLSSVTPCPAIIGTLLDEISLRGSGGSDILTSSASERLEISLGMAIDFIFDTMRCYGGGGLLPALQRQWTAAALFRYSFPVLAIVEEAARECVIASLFA